MDRFGFNESNLKPLRYSLCYHLERDDILGEGGGTDELFIDLAAHYDQFTLHYIHNITNDSESYMVISDNTDPLIPDSGTPLK